jgi:dienelactone hydrolase
MVFTGSLAVGAIDTFEKGKVIEKVVCQQNPDESYALYLPSTYSEQEKWPVLFAFEPAARAALPVKLFKNAAEKYGYIVLCPSNVKNGPREPIAKAMHAVWIDLNDRFSIDKERIYATGFSGGARMSTFFHLVTRSAVKGIIAVGAGLSDAIKADQIRLTHYFGICGYADFNYSEMVKLEHTLKNQGTAHRFVYYDAKHRWPPETICTRALEWLELMAMKDDIIPKDDRKAFIAKSFEKELKLAEEREREGEIFYAAGDYEAITRVFQGLTAATDLKSIKQRAVELRKSKGYKSFDKQETKRLKDEYEYIRKFVGGFNVLKQQDPKTIRLSKILAAMGVPVLDRVVKKKKNLYDASMAERVLYNLTSKSRMEGEAYLVKGELARAELFWEMGAQAGKYSWFNGWMQYRLASVYALQGRTKKAIKTLKQAIENGFKRVNMLKTDKNLNSLRANPAFHQLLNQLKKSDQSIQTQ